MSHHHNHDHSAHDDHGHDHGHEGHDHSDETEPALQTLIWKQIDCRSHFLPMKVPQSIKTSRVLDVLNSPFMKHFSVKSHYDVVLKC